MNLDPAVADVGTGVWTPLIGDWDASGTPDLAFPTQHCDGFWLVPGEDLPWGERGAW